MIRAGKCAEARGRLDKRISADPKNARLYVFRALSRVPGLARTFPATPSASSFNPKKGWSDAEENFALDDLASALRARGGKRSMDSDFNAYAYLFRAKIFARRVVTASKSENKTAWLGPFSQFSGEISRISAGTAKPKAARIKKIIMKLTPGEYVTPGS